MPHGYNSLQAFSDFCSVMGGAVCRTWSPTMSCAIRLDYGAVGMCSSACVVNIIAVVTLCPLWIPCRVSLSEALFEAVIFNSHRTLA